MWILKNSKEPFIKFKISFIKITLHSTPPPPQIYDFSTFYITFPHDKIKSRLFETIENCFFNNDGFRKFTYLDTRLSAVSIEVIISVSTIVDTTALSATTCTNFGQVDADLSFSYSLLGNYYSSNCLRISLFSQLRQRANSSTAPDPTSDSCRGPCLFCFCFVSFL